MRIAERRKVNVLLKIKCLRSLVEVSRMDRVRNEDPQPEEVRRRAGIERKLL